MRSDRTALWMALAAFLAWMSVPMPAAAAEAAGPEAAGRTLRAGAATSNITPWLDEPVVGGRLEVA